MRNRQLLTTLLPAILAGFFAGNASAQVAHLTFQSEPGDWIGGGGSRDIIYTASNSTFFFWLLPRTLPSGEPTQIVFALGGGQTPNASLYFGTDQLGIPLQPGFYPDAERASFASPGHPGLDFAFGSRGCNTITGSFTVHEFLYSSSLGIQSFSASFEQHCDGLPPALSGTFTFQAVPEPSALSLFVLSSLGVVGLLVYRKRFCLVLRWRS